MSGLDRRTRTINVLIRFSVFVVYLVIGLLVFKAIENAHRPDKHEYEHASESFDHHDDKNHSALEQLKRNVTKRLKISSSQFDRLVNEILHAHWEDEGHEDWEDEGHEDWEDEDHQSKDEKHRVNEAEHPEHHEGHHEDNGMETQYIHEENEDHHENVDHHKVEWWEEKLTYQESFALAFHTITTIGYGHVTPETTGGKVFCVFYAAFGIPLTFLFLYAVGEELFNFQKFSVRKLESRLLRKGIVRKLELKCLIITLLEILLLLVIGGGIQKGAERWSFGEGMYCWFITLTTIGYGDLIPGEDKEGHEIPMIFFTIIGLCVMANLVHILINYASDGVFTFGVKKIRGERLEMEAVIAEDH